MIWCGCFLHLILQSIVYENFKKQFGEDGTVLFIGIQDKNLFTLDKFNDWFDLSNKIRKIQGVEEVLSNTCLYRLQKNDSIKKFEFKPICPTKPKTQKELDSLKNVIYSLPLYDNLIFNKKTGATLMMVTINKEEINSKRRVPLIHDIKATADSFGVKYHTGVHYSGLPYIRTRNLTKSRKRTEVLCLTGFIGCSRIPLYFLPFLQSGSVSDDHYCDQRNMGIGNDCSFRIQDYYPYRNHSSIDHRDRSRELYFPAQQISLRIQGSIKTKPNPYPV